MIRCENYWLLGEETEREVVADLQLELLRVSTDLRGFCRRRRGWVADGKRASSVHLQLEIGSANRRSEEGER